MAHSTIFVFLAIFIFLPSALTQNNLPENENLRSIYEKNFGSNNVPSDDIRKHYIKMRCLINPTSCYKAVKKRSNEPNTDHNHKLSYESNEHFGRLLRNQRTASERLGKKVKKLMERLNKQPAQGSESRMKRSTCVTGLEVGHCEHMISRDREPLGGGPEKPNKKNTGLPSKNDSLKVGR